MEIDRLVQVPDGAEQIRCPVRRGGEVCGAPVRGEASAVLAVLVVDGRVTCAPIGLAPAPAFHCERGHVIFDRTEAWMDALEGATEDVTAAWSEPAEPSVLTFPGLRTLPTVPDDVA
jgi:hypothetical protein